MRTARRNTEVPFTVIQGGMPSHRVRGEHMSAVIRATLVNAAKDTGQYPNGELFERLRPERQREPSMASVCEGLSELSAMRALKMPTWQRVTAAVHGAIDALVTPVPASYHALHVQEARADGESDVAKLELVDAMRTGDVVAMRHGAAKIRDQIFHAQQLAASVEARILECLPRRGSWA